MHDSLWLLIKLNRRKLGKKHNHNKQHPFFKIDGSWWKGR